MDTLTLVATALALGTDAFAVGTCVAAGLVSLTARHAFRLTWHFGFFQAMMTVFGWFGGESISSSMRGINYWIAFALLLLLGLNMIRQSLHPECRTDAYDPTRGWSLVGLSVATSLDALAVGASLGLIGVVIWTPALVIGLAALAMTFAGMMLGRQVGIHLGKWAERLGGVVLIAIGIRILVQYAVQ